MINRIKPTKKKMVIACAICLITLIVPISCVFPIAQKTHNTPTTQVAITPVETGFTYVSHKVKSGETFSSIFSGFGISKAVSAICFQKLKPLGLTTLFPGDSLILRLQHDSLVQCSIRNNLEYWYQLNKLDTGYTVCRNDIPAITVRSALRGTLSSSLSYDMVQRGVTDALVAKFADIFAWDINFFTDPQKGDQFEVVFEAQYKEGAVVNYGAILAARYITARDTFCAIGVPGENGSHTYFDEKGRSLQKQFLKAPLSYSRISSGFSFHRKHPVLGIVRPHLGIDYAAPTGTPVRAIANGTITFAGSKGGFGRFIAISHGSYTSTYGHLNSIASKIRYGSRVTQGDIIGTVGSSGLSTGPHLDYRLTCNGRFINPQTLQPPPQKNIDIALQPVLASLTAEYRVIFDIRLSGVSSGYCMLDMQQRTYPPDLTALAMTTSDLSMTAE